jgi:hypothetical protein
VFPVIADKFFTRKFAATFRNQPFYRDKLLIGIGNEPGADDTQGAEDSINRIHPAPLHGRDGLIKNESLPTSRARRNPAGRISVTNTTASVSPAQRLALLNLNCSNLFRGEKMAASSTAQKIAKKKGFRIWANRNVTNASNRTKINLGKPAKRLSNMGHPPRI